MQHNPGRFAGEEVELSRTAQSPGSSQSRHVDVEEHDVRLELSQCDGETEAAAERGCPVPGRAKYPLDRAHRQGIVVHDENSQGHGWDIVRPRKNLSPILEPSSRDAARSRYPHQMSEPTNPDIRHGASLAGDPREAVRELHRAIDLPDPALVIFYCSPRYDRDAIAAQVRECFGDTEVIGCTTAGEISPAGYRDGSLVGVAISRRVAECATMRLNDLSTFELADGTALAESLRERLQKDGSAPSGEDCFGFMLIDGLSTKEEHVVSGIYRGMGDIPLVGGSAADGDAFGETFVYHDGAFHRDACVLSLVRTSLPFDVFRTQHFVPTDRKMVVTGADVASRTVLEINGEPAGREYARMVGLDVDKLSPLTFAAHPVVVRVGGEYYVRSIMKANDDGSLSFACAIDEGIVVTVAEGVDVIDNLSGAFADLRSRIGPPQLVLGCDCFFRLLELDQREIRDDVADIMAANNVVGFATYGEQFHGMHINQTFTGIALGRTGTSG